MGDAAPRVFVSYSHDSDEHKDLVRRFAHFLRTGVGLDAQLDQWDDDERRDWSVWAMDQLKLADYILVIASPDYKRRAEGSAPPHEGRGAQFEAAMIRDNLTRDLAGQIRRVLPVVLPGRSVDEIPVFLNPYSTTHYVIPEITVDGVESLLGAITGTPRHRMPARAPFVPPTRTAVHPVALAAPVALVSPRDILSPGAEISIGQSTFLVHSDHYDQTRSPDQTVIRRQARGLRTNPPGEYVWIRQVDVREGIATHLRAESDLLATLGVPGIPRVVAFVGGERLTTLVTTWGDGKPADALSEYVPSAGEVIDTARMAWVLRGMASLCRTLEELHAAGKAHRALVPDGVVVLGDGRFMVRDLGLAVVAGMPGEASGDYQAPEQQRRRGGEVGPPTDVYRVAAITYHLLTGSAPLPDPLPVGVLAPSLPDKTAAVLDAALAVDPRERPEMAALGSRFAE